MIRLWRGISRVLLGGWACCRYCGRRYVAHEPPVQRITAMPVGGGRCPEWHEGYVRYANPFAILIHNEYSEWREEFGPGASNTERGEATDAKP